MHDNETQRHFAQLIERHHTLIQRLCLFKAEGDDHLYAEFQQQCLIHIWRHLPSLRPNSSPLQESLWVYWQCRSVFSRYNLFQKTHLTLPLDESCYIIPDTTPDESPLHDTDQFAHILSKTELHILQLIVQGYHNDEIADILHIKPRSVIQQRYRIITKLRKYFNTNQ